MINQKVFIDSQGINFQILFDFFQKSDLSVFVELEKFQPWYLRSELWSHKTSFEVIKDISGLILQTSSITPDICYYPAGYPVLSGQISGIIRPDIRLGN